MYLVGIGFISAAAALVYVVFVAVAWWWSGSQYVGWGAQAMPYAAMLWVALRWARLMGLALVGWLLLVVLVTWPRFPHKAVEFLRGIADIFK